MLTCSHGGQAVGKAVSICLKNKWTPRTLAKKDNIGKLQLALSRDGQSIPRLDIPDNKDLIQIATISSSSDLKIDQLKPCGEWKKLEFNMAQLLPLEANKKYCFKFKLKASNDTFVSITLKTSSNQKHFTPDIELESKKFPLKKGIQEISFSCEKNHH